MTLLLFGLHVNLTSNVHIVVVLHFRSSRRWNEEEEEDILFPWKKNFIENSSYITDSRRVHSIRRTVKCCIREKNNVCIYKAYTEDEPLRKLFN